MDFLKYELRDHGYELFELGEEVIKNEQVLHNQKLNVPGMKHERIKNKKGLDKKKPIFE